MRWLGGISGSMDRGLSKLREMVRDRETACCGPSGCKELDTTKRLNKSRSGDTNTFLIRNIVKSKQIVDLKGVAQCLTPMRASFPTPASSSPP